MPRRLSLLVLVFGLVIGTPLLASPSGERGGQGAPQVHQSAAAGNRASGLWKRLTALWAAAGCILDPDGAKCSSAPAGGTAVVAQPPEGCGLDPNGCR